MAIFEKSTFKKLRFLGTIRFENKTKQNLGELQWNLSGRHFRYGDTGNYVNATATDDLSELRERCEKRRSRRMAHYSRPTPRCAQSGPVVSRPKLCLSRASIESLDNYRFTQLLINRSLTLFSIPTAFRLQRKEEEEKKGQVGGSSGHLLIETAASPDKNPATRMSDDRIHHSAPSISTPSSKHAAAARLLSISITLTSALLLFLFFRIQFHFYFSQNQWRSFSEYY